MTHQSLGVITEMNVAVDPGDDGWVRVNMIDEDGNSTSALIEKDAAESAAALMSPDLYKMEWLEKKDKWAFLLNK